MTLRRNASSPRETGLPSGTGPACARTFPRSDLGAGFARPSDDGGFEEFREFEATRAAKSATCD